VRHWIASGGNQFFAFQQAYSARDAETARKGSYAIAKSVKEVADLFLMKTDKEKFIEEIDRVLRSRNLKPSKLRALELKARVLFGVDLKSLSKKSVKSEEATASELPMFDPNARYIVSARAIYQGRAIEITAVNSEGRATDYEWAGDPQSPVAW